MKVLFADDDKAILSYVKEGFANSGHQVELACDGKEALYFVTVQQYDVIIIDWMMPYIDGISLTKIIRKQCINTPIIILSALAQTDHKIEGFQSGGDDYLTKPFAIEELVIRAEVLAKKNKLLHTKELVVLSCQDLVVDLISHQVTRSGEVLALQAREYELLVYLLQNKNQVLTRNMILEHVWKYDFDPQTNVIDVHISRLRQKLTRDSRYADMIETVRGYGYVIKDKS
ncbi:response regulator transcription factor [Thiotrichales bacterium 19S3-7]|nr:response regulator transcription factor [Thiotrichales bacterium 19S3-7]MCF6800644.1 response regulator transcription factor [Thiotrichales bacterium 19S3-11]